MQRNCIKISIQKSQNLLIFYFKKLTNITFLKFIIIVIQYLNIYFRTNTYKVGFPGGSDGKESAFNAGDRGSIPGMGRSLGKGNGYPHQYFAWKIPWTEEPGGLQSMGSQRVRHHWATNTFTFTCKVRGTFWALHHEEQDA